MARSRNRLSQSRRERTRWRVQAELLEPRCMLAAGDYDLSFNGTGFNITSSTSDLPQFSTTMGIFPVPPYYVVMGGYREVPKTGDRIKNPADLELIFLDDNGNLVTSIGNGGSVTEQVGLGDSRIAGLDFQIIGSTLYIVTAGYTVVSGSDLEFTLDFNSPTTPFAVKAFSRPFRVEDIGATLEILDDNNNNSPWAPDTYEIVDVIGEIAYLDREPAAIPGASNGRWTLNGSTDMLISRFVYTGGDVVIDTSFGRNGHVILPVAHGVNNFDYAYAIDIDREDQPIPFDPGRIVVAGYSQNESGEYDMSVARLLSNGNLDTSFYFDNQQPNGPLANPGRVMINIDKDDFANTVAVRPNNQIFIAGSSGGGKNPVPTYVKLTESGEPATAFGPNSDGIVVLTSKEAGKGFVNSTELYPGSAGSLAGYLISTGTRFAGDKETFIVRMNGETGALDTTFGEDGIVNDDLSNTDNDYGNSVTLQAAGGGQFAVVIAGSIQVKQEDYNMYVARYLANGDRDDTFFNDGHIHILSELHQGNDRDNPDYGATVEMDRLNRIVVSGSVSTEDPDDSPGDSDFDMTGARLIGSPAVATPLVNAISRAVVEGNAGAKDVVIELLLTSAMSAPVTVNYTTANGTGKAGVDYVTKSGNVTFAPGDTRQTVTVKTLGNTTYQPNRTFALQVTGVTGAAMGTAAAQITIRDNDGTWQNVDVPEDVDADNDVEPQDVLRLADDYRANGARQLTQALATPTLWYDVDGDTTVSPADILAVVDAVNRKSFFSSQLLATNESSAAIAANTMSETDSSVNVEVASGLAAPVGSGETSAVKRPTESAVIVSASSPSAQASSLPTAAIDSALADFASEADDTTTEADEDLYSLISDES